MRKPMSLLPLVLVAACASGKAAETESQLSGVQGERSFTAAGFDRVSLRGSDNVVVRVGPGESVVARGDTAILDRLEIEVVDGELRVGRKEQKGFRWGGQRGHATVTVTLPRLVAASVAGSGDMEVDRAQADRFGASVAGSGNLRIANLVANSTDLAVAGSGNARIAGRSRDLDLNVAGSGNAEAGGFRAQRADVSIAGSGNAAVTVDSVANVSIVGSGNADILGSAKCSVSKMGSGTVRCANAT